jgi:hypothetical protein
MGDAKRHSFFFVVKLHAAAADGQLKGVWRPGTEPPESGGVRGDVFSAEWKSLSSFNLTCTI